MLKKVLCLLLVLATSVVLFACGGSENANTNPSENNPPVVNNPSDDKTGEETGGNKEFVDNKSEVDLAREQTFFAVVNNSKPNVIVTQTNTTDSKLGTAVGFYRTTIYGDGEYSFYYEYEVFNKIGEGDKLKEKIGPATIYYKDGQYSLDNEVWVYDNPDPAALNVKLELDKKLLGNYTVSADGTELKTKVSAADAEKILGVKITATTKIDITVKTDGTHLWNIAVDYTNGNTAVHIETSYTYENVSNSAQ